MNTSALAVHDSFFEAAFQELLDAERERTSLESELAAYTITMKSKINALENKETEARTTLDGMMKETGEYESVISLDGHSYKLYYSTPRQRIKADADATPDEFCKIERKPKLKEIGEYLKTCDSLPNWASIEEGESKLQWRAIKPQGRSKDDE